MKLIFSYDKKKVYGISQISIVIMFQKEKGGGTANVFPTAIWRNILYLKKNLKNPILFMLDMIFSLSDHSVETRKFPSTFFKYW